jgi:hypothetical protein
LPQSERCLHCDRPRGGDNHVQVRCDECSNFICTSCHWCHEFQGNHEIRVCGYCDVFYCKECDEMDQCDDCQETVCGSCSTLLTCKFCGGGLCEECATACGRYVLYFLLLLFVACNVLPWIFLLLLFFPRSHSSGTSFFVWTPRNLQRWIMVHVSLKNKEAQI